MTKNKLYKVTYTQTFWEIAKSKEEAIENGWKDFQSTFSDMDVDDFGEDAEEVTDPKELKDWELELKGGD